MTYEIVYLKEKIVAGLIVRTSNGDANMTKVIGETWKSFFEEGIYQTIMNKKNENTIGLYSNYENKVNGEYDVVVCCEVSKEEKFPEGIQVRKIEKGKYAKFKIKGHVQEAVWEFWNKLWEMNLDRKYSFDFEEYKGGTEMKDSEIDIYISIN